MKKNFSLIDYATILSIILYERKLVPAKIKKVSNEFTYLIQSHLNSSKLKELRTLNSQAEDNVCFTHDFCDPNEFMYQACEQFYILHTNFDSEIWNNAWKESRRCNFRLGFLPRVYYSLWNYSKWGSFTTDPESEVI
jgi:hypothetical protein